MKKRLVEFKDTQYQKVAINPEKIEYVKKYNGLSIIYMGNAHICLSHTYEDTLHRLQSAGDILLIGIEETVEFNERSI